MTFATVQDYFAEAARVASTVDVRQVGRLRNMVAQVASRDGVLYVAGNGGSATVADHMAIGMTLNALRENGKPVRAVSLTNGVMLSGAGNDFGQSHVFSAQLRAIGRPADMLLVMSGSGRSANVVAALDEARRIGMPSAAIVGSLGVVAQAADQVVLVPTLSAGICEDVTIMLLHWVYGEFMKREASCLAP